VLEWSKQARVLAEPIIEQGGSKAGDEDAVTQVDSLSRRAASFVHDRAIAAMNEGKVPGLIGGEHGVAYGLYKAVAERHPGVGILQIDAHMDLRAAFEGFAWSHASVMHNVVHDLDGVSRIVQVGIRDYCEQEAALAESLAPDKAPEGETQIITFFWDDIADERLGGGAWPVICERIVNRLPAEVIIDIDIDGLDPTLCPHTGTPVPGGLSWDELSVLLRMIKESERSVVAFDLVEVCPSRVPEASPTDASIGARVLYRLCGCI
jgi:agmatinase